MPRVAMLAPLSVAELDVSIGEVRSGRADPANQGRADQQAQLRELHQSLIRATPLLVRPPLPSLASATELLADFRIEWVEALPPRPRTVFRLLRAGAFDAAWEVLIDNAAGVVDELSDASTATGSARSASRLPLLTRVEPPKVFADLPGFRDPRFGAPDDCYDITGVVRMRQHLDEVCVADSAATFGGWAALDALVTGADEQVRLIAASRDNDVAVSGRRLRRPDLVSETGDAWARRAWAGWTARLDLADPRLVVGSWALSLELEHAGVLRRTPIGVAASDLARAATRTPIHLESRSVRWETGQPQWHLVVTAD